MNDMTPPQKMTPKDWETDQEVRWCPGCGDYAILKAVQRTLPEIGARPESTVFVSGIGCSSRFPYYVESYGFHTIHGRAPAVARRMEAMSRWLAAAGEGQAAQVAAGFARRLQAAGSDEAGLTEMLSFLETAARRRQEAQDQNKENRHV